MNLTLNGKSETVESGTTVSALLARLELPPMRVAVEINEDVVRRRTFDETVLQDGDTIEIVTFVGGG